MSHIVYIRATSIYCQYKTTKEIKTLAEAGHHIRVIGWDRSGEALGRCASIFAPYSDRVSFAFYSPDTECGAWIRNISEIFSWFEFVTESLEKIIDEIDWVHACNLVSGWPAYRVCEKYGRKLVYDIYDYFIYSNTLPPEICSTVEKMEISVINYADTTIICSEERREEIRKASPRKVAVIHNSPDMANIATDLPAIWDYAYCGSFPKDRLLEEILTEYPSHRDLRFVFAGWGYYQALVEECAGAAENFMFQGRIPGSEALKIESRSKVLSAIYRPTKRNHRWCTPNKFYEALALGKPVIVCRGTGIDRIVEENEIGTVIDYDVQEFYQALRDLLSDGERRTEMGIRARSVYESKYDWAIMKERLIRIYQD